MTVAQRNHDAPSAEGPLNIRTAVRAVTDERIQRSGGVYVAFNKELHAARDVEKIHPYKVNGFSSPGKGPVAEVTPNAIRSVREPGSRTPFISGVTVAKTVELVQNAIGVSGRQVARALTDDVNGFVVSGTGLENMSPALGSAIRNALDQSVPVVLTSRCQAGAIDRVYGTSSGGRSLFDAGVLAGDDLPPHKARIKLDLGLTHTADENGLWTLFKKT